MLRWIPVGLCQNARFANQFCRAWVIGVVRIEKGMRKDDVWAMSTDLLNQAVTKLRRNVDWIVANVKEPNVCTENGRRLFRFRTADGLDLLQALPVYPQAGRLTAFAKA